MSSTHTTAGRAQARMGAGTVVLALSLLLGVQPITTDLYLPALPALTAALGATMPQAQLTLTALLLAFGLSQLAWGPVSDRVGRRPVLLTGLALYVLASVGSAWAGSVGQLIAWRTLQGFAMGASVMGARAIVRDLYAPAEGARTMSKALTGLGVIACAGTPLGGLLAQYLGWRAALSALAVFGAFALAVLAWRFEETLARPNPQALRPATLLHTWLGIVRHPTFWAHTLLSSASYAGLFTFLAASSFVFIDVLGLSKVAYGALMFTVSSSYIVGTLVCRWLLPRLGLRRTVALAGGCTLLAGTLMGALALGGVRHVAAILVPQYLFMIAHGVHQPCGQSGCVAPFPHAAGAASALSGFLMMVAAFGMGGWLGLSLAGVASGTGTVLPLTNGIWFWSVCICAIAWTLVQRHGEVQAPPLRRPAAGGDPPAS
jgi:DHA1 family bicyclomycin/chloramphenicol resistance-like MFS transporter